MEEFPEAAPTVVGIPARTNRLRVWWKSESAVRTTELGVGAFAIGILFWRLQFATSAICCGDFDGYYHMKWAQLLWQNIKAKHLRPPAFTWLPLTTLNAGDYVDHHLLFHVLLIPFTWFRDMQIGAKVATVIFASVAVFTCYWLIVRYEVRYRLLWLLALLACSAPFLYRMNMTKAPPFAILFLVIGTYFMFERKHWQLLPLALIFTWTYDLFVLLLLAAGIWTAVVAWTEERFDWRPLAYVAAGCALGLIINPYFPHNLHLFWEHVRIKITVGDFATKVGNEWYPYNTREFLANCFVALVAMFAGYLAFDGTDRKQSKKPLYFLALSTALLVMNLFWKRFAEYFPPFAILFVAFTFEEYWRGRAVFTRLPDDVLQDLQPFLDRQEPTDVAKEKKNAETWRTVKIALAAAALAVIFLINVHQTTGDISESEPRDYYSQGASWMRANIPAGQVVFNTDWDDFPRLFYFDPTHAYVSGLDPTYLLDRSPELSQLYVEITTGETEDPGPYIRDRFGAQWVFTDTTNDHVSFMDNARRSGWFDIAYEDKQCRVLHIRPTKGEPLADTDRDGGGGDTGNDNSP